MWNGFAYGVISCPMLWWVNLKLTLTRPIGLPPHAPVAQKVAEQCTLIAGLVKGLFVRVDWTERLRDDSSTTD